MEAERFLELIRQSKRGKCKIYIGMSAGVGKTFRMLQEAHSLLRSGIDVQIGFVETHRRPETAALLEGLPVIGRRTLFYKGKALEEMDLQAILNLRPEVVIVDELAHTNIEGSKNEKRWQDVLEILDHGISVISAVNIQHIESLNEEIQEITGIEIKERVPDSVLRAADEVVNIDLTVDELIARLREGKIYEKNKVEIALRNFFQSEKLLQLRELALREVASQVERKIASEVPGQAQPAGDRFMACISSNAETARRIIRKTARLANYYQSKWYVLYVQTPQESADRIGLAAQRHLINNFKLATELGAEVLKVSHNEVARAIVQTAAQHHITTVCIGHPKVGLKDILLNQAIAPRLLRTLSGTDTDLMIFS